MSLTAIIPYFRKVCTDNGLREWTDAFNVENIPSNIYDKCFHLSWGDINGESPQNIGQFINSLATIRFFMKGYKEPAKVKEDAMALGESILKDACSPARRSLVPEIKNVTFQSMRPDPVSGSNDNTIMITQNFLVRTALCYS